MKNNTRPSGALYKLIPARLTAACHEFLTWCHEKIVSVTGQMSKCRGGKGRPTLYTEAIVTTNDSIGTVWE